jgi:hypothetical protein
MRVKRPSLQRTVFWAQKKHLIRTYEYAMILVRDEIISMDRLPRLG